MASSGGTDHRQSLRQAEELLGKYLQLASGTHAKTEHSHRHCLGMWEQSSRFQGLNMSWRKSEVSGEQRRSGQDKTGRFGTPRLWGARACAEAGVTRKILC